MKAIIFVIALSVALCSVAFSEDAAKPGKIAIKANDQLLSEVAKTVGEGANISIVVDPKVDAKITTSASDLDLTKAMNMLSESVSGTWKKVQFAKSSTDKVSLDQIKSTIIALAGLPLMAASVQDSEGKVSSVFAKSVPAKDDTSAIKLPDGYKWATVYVIYAQPKDSDKTASDKPDTKDLNKQAMEKANQLSGLTPEERQGYFKNEMAGIMSLAPEVRQSILKDQMSAVFNSDQTMRDQYMNDFREAMRSLWGNNGGQGGPGGGGNFGGGGGRRGGGGGGGRVQPAQ